MLNRLLGKTSAEEKEKRAEEYQEGKHIDIVPKGYIPGEQLWIDYKQSNNPDYELHNTKNLNQPGNVIRSDEVPSLEKFDKKDLS